MNDKNRAIEAIKSGLVLYTRFDPHFGGYIKAYRRDATSPTGVMLLGGFSEASWNEAVKELGVSNNGNYCPLSPTERW